MLNYRIFCLNYYFRFSLNDNRLDNRLWWLILLAHNFCLLRCALLSGILLLLNTKLYLLVLLTFSSCFNICISWSAADQPWLFILRRRSNYNLAKLQLINLLFVVRGTYINLCVWCFFIFSLDCSVSISRFENSCLLFFNACDQFFLPFFFRYGILVTSFTCGLLHSALFCCDFLLLWWTGTHLNY